jgi:TrmH family RNA methyltransferase
VKLKIKFILFEPTHPGNIGAAARAIKTMGFDKLCLINPIEHPHPEARARSAGALDVLLGAEVFDNLQDAIKGCGLIIGTTARTRRISVPIENIRETAASIFAEAKQKPVAVIFGPEKSGLINEQVDCCNQLVNIPSIGAYKSLNLAMAVQIVAYELRVASEALPAEIKARNLASNEDIELFYNHLNQVLLETGFLDPKNPKQLMRRLRALFNRAQMDENEINIMRGILASYKTQQ